VAELRRLLAPPPRTLVTACDSDLIVASWVYHHQNIIFPYKMEILVADVVRCAHPAPERKTRFLQMTKPALLFASGAWFVLHLLNRRT
jgi:hypothetical protein